jgi:hypothetical protein
MRQFAYTDSTMSTVLSTIPQNAKTPKRVPLRIDEAVFIEMHEEQLRLYKATGSKPSILDLVSGAWAAYKREREASA